MWRQSEEWGAVYAGAMTDCNAAIQSVHDRMPVILHPDEYDRWLRRSFDDLLAFQARCLPAELIQMERTSELWVKRQPAASSEMTRPATLIHLRPSPSSPKLKPQRRFESDST